MFLKILYFFHIIIRMEQLRLENAQANTALYE